MTKLEKIIDIINKNKEGKFLIFSDHDGSFVSINKVLKENDISCVQIRGNIKTTEKNLRSFKYGDTSVIFLNSKFNGAGINLQEASDLIVYHEMSSTTLNQIIGRANRIGRENSLEVHQFLATMSQKGYIEWNDLIYPITKEKIQKALFILKNNTSLNNLEHLELAFYLKE